jgi:hypothetical protein
MGVVSRVFRGKFVEGLRRAYARGELDLSGATDRFSSEWWLEVQRSRDIRGDMYSIT